MRHKACDAIAKGARTLVISDRDSDHTRAPIPSLLAVAAVHHHLVRTKQRTMVALVVESGDAREVHHIALLIGYGGAAAVNPYLAFESIEDLIREGELTGIDAGTAVRNYLKALGKGVMKVMSKMGISTVGSYTGAQAFEAIGLSKDVVDEYLTGTVSQLGGVGLDVLADEVKQRHRRAIRRIRPSGCTAGSRSAVSTSSAARANCTCSPRKPSSCSSIRRAPGETTSSPNTPRRSTGSPARAERCAACSASKKGLRPPVPLHEVESVDAICARFNTGAMSYGSISQEAHETMAIAMNNLGGRSNSGEGGGEDEDRLYDPRRRSAVKQVASGRFGVTSDYLVNATDIQIKMAQGAKPGEGGQLPGFKVYPNIAKTRHSTPGVGLISPPPHHDIYSIEDLAQLIHDLKNANSQARIHVKLVSSVGGRHRGGRGCPRHTPTSC